MNNSPTAATVERLLAETGYPRISLFMPTHRAGADIWQDPIRFKNLIRSAEHNLEAAPIGRNEIFTLLEPLVALQQDHDFWQYQADGLAVFSSLGKMEEFRLASPVPELCVVADRYHLKPVLMSLADDQRYFVLALSKNAVRLFRASTNGLREVEGLDLPKGMTPPYTGSEKPLNGHVTRAGTLINHGHDLDHKREIAEYCHEIDQIVKPAVGPHAVVIVAAVDYIAAIYRHESEIDGLHPTLISGNPDHLGPSELFEKASPIAASHFDKRHGEAESRFFAGLHTGKALDRPVDVIHAAREGRVDTLFVPIGVHLWGRLLDGEQVRLSQSQQPDDQDLLNGALIDTWKAGGKVLAVMPEKMPGGRQVAAIVRY